MIHPYLRGNKRAFDLWIAYYDARKHGSFIGPLDECAHNQKARTVKWLQERERKNAVIKRDFFKHIALIAKSITEANSGDTSDDT